jgi:hypothetical protein
MILPDEGTGNWAAVTKEQESSRTRANTFICAKFSATISVKFFNKRG